MGFYLILKKWNLLLLGLLNLGFWLSFTCVITAITTPGSGSKENDWFLGPLILVFWAVQIWLSQFYWPTIQQVSVLYNYDQTVANINRREIKLRKLPSHILQLIKEDLKEQTKRIFSPGRRFYVAPQIPMFILKNALVNFLYIQPDEELLLVADESFFGNCKSGYALTTRRLYWRYEKKVDLVESCAYINMETPIRIIGWGIRLKVGKDLEVNISETDGIAGTNLLKFLSYAIQKYQGATCV